MKFCYSDDFQSSISILSGHFVINDGKNELDNVENQESVPSLKDTSILQSLDQTLLVKKARGGMGERQALPGLWD